VFAPETTAFLEGGCSLVVGTVGVDGEPTASRGWGLTVLSRERGECSLLLDAGAEKFLADLRRTEVLAVTAADVPTLRAIQLKGRITSLAPASAVERDRAEEYTDAFFGDITRTDGTDRSVLNRMKPVEYIACVTRFAEIYDQTPGPVAGAAIHGNVP
jgi:hypothetical protein